jgi:NADH:ubiquinone oxidoreductase subunit F (NADH-binding)
MDYESFAISGVSMGSGALLVCDESVCVVDLACVLLNFFRRECCGKCTPCRVGTERAHQILTRLAAGQGQLDDLEQLSRLAQNLEQLSNCGLGQTAATPLRDTLKYFRAEVEAHIRLKVCPAGVCTLRAAPVSD